MQFTSKSDSGQISVEILISKFHPNFASKYHSKCGQHFTRFQCRRHYVADIFGHSISPKMSPTFNKCRRHLRRHFRRNYQNIGWVHRCDLGFYADVFQNINVKRFIKESVHWLVQLCSTSTKQTVTIQNLFKDKERLG